MYIMTTPRSNYIKMAVAADPPQPSTDDQNRTPAIFECFSTLIDRHQGPAACFSDQQEYISTLNFMKLNKGKPLDLKLLQSNHSKVSLKNHVRAGVLPNARRSYWRVCLRIKDEDVVVYSKALGHSEQANAVVYDPVPTVYEVPSFSQKPSFTRALYQVTRHINVMNHELVSHCPLLPIMAHVFLHVLEEWECYVGLRCLLTRQGWIDRTPIECTASLLTLGKLLSSHLRSVDLSPFKPVGMGHTFFIMEFFSQWYLWPFTTRYFWFTIRVMDLYLNEGSKALYRLALAAVKMFKKSSMFSNTASGDIPIPNLMSYYLSNLTLEETCEWARQSLNLPRLRTETLMKLWLNNCSVAEQMKGGNVPVSLSPPPLTEGPSPDHQKKFIRNLTVDPISEILDENDSANIDKWLPEWVQGNVLKCLFQASKHGYNLRTLYRKCDDIEPIIIIIKSTDNAVFGTIVVGDLKERHNNTFFGSGETVLFSLKPVAVSYSWTAESDLILRANDEEIIVGSGGGQFGLWIDGDLNRGSSANCSSYNNEPLTGNGNVDFKCAAVEVFSVEFDD